MLVYSLAATEIAASFYKYKNLLLFRVVFTGHNTRTEKNTINAALKMILQRLFTRYVSLLESTLSVNESGTRGALCNTIPAWRKWEVRARPTSVNSLELIRVTKPVARLTPSVTDDNLYSLSKIVCLAPGLHLEWVRCSWSIGSHILLFIFKDSVSL